MWLAGTMATLALCVEVFQPGLGWLLYVGFHRNPVTTAHFEVFIPRDWDVLLQSGEAVSTVKRDRCLTRFCSQSPDNAALVTITWSDKLRQADNKGWDNIKMATLRALQKDGASTAIRDITVGTLGSVQCVEGKAPAPASAVTRSCFAPQAELWVEFYGNPEHLRAFDRMVSAIRTH